MPWNVKRLRGSKDKVIQCLSAVMGRCINLRKKGKPGKKTSVGIGRRSRWQDKGGD